MVNQDDRVYQADLGKETSEKAQAIDKFAAVDPWQPVEP